MLDNLLKDLEKIKKELESINLDSLTDKELSQIEKLTEKVLKSFENANIELPEEHSDDGGEQTPGSEI